MPRNIIDRRGRRAISPDSRIGAAKARARWVPLCQISSTSLRGGPIHNLRRESVHGPPRRLAARRDACVDHNPRFCRSSGAGWSNKSIEEPAKTYHNSSYALPTILSKSIVPSRYLFCWLTSTVDSAWRLRARRTTARRLLDVLSRLFRVRSTPLMVLRRAAPPHDIIPAEKDVARVAVGR